MTLSTTSSEKDQLVSALVARGIDNGSEVADSLESLAGCMSVVAYFDDHCAGKGPGLLVHLLRTGQRRDYRPEKRDAPSFWQTGFHDLVDEMRAEGFDERQAPLAASAVMVRPKASRAGLRAHLAAQYPDVFEEGDDDD